MEKFIFLLSLSILTFCSCEKQEFEQVCEIPEFSDSHTIPITLALENLQRLRSELYPETKSSQDDILSIDVFGRQDTKAQDSSIPDTLLYLVNFKDDGFAILSGQSKLNSPVFCITDEGNLPSSLMDEAMNKLSSDTNTKTMSEDEEFEDCGEMLVPMLILSSAINQMDQEEDYLSNEDVKTKSDVYKDVNKCGPYLKTKWHQSSPFNTYIKNGCPAGCVAIATAQILEFNKICNPKKQSFNWSLLETVNNCSMPYSSGSSLAQKEASRFLQYVGNSDNCNIKYKKSGSSGNADGAKRTLNNFNYHNVVKSMGFETKDKNKLIAHLVKGLPAYMDGMYKLKTGHAWVVDGLYVREVLDASSMNHKRTENLFHINWGWNGMSDGYYTQGVFDTSRRITTESGVDSGSACSSQKYTWDYRTIVYDID